ncbi:EAL domain-containing protein [Clostridium sp.]|uniref:bifunctional diguanylate cyclase/phosphodiesterase n=1 Tax=Clostridium sp. TaxID=1506 RepID=UPI003217FA1C
MDKFYWHDMKRILRSYILIIIPIIFATIFVYSYISRSEIEKTRDVVIEEQKQKSKVINYIIEDIVQDIYEDLLVMKNSNEVYNYINQTNDYNLLQAEQLLLRVANNKKNFDKIRIINSEGREVISVNNEKGGPNLIPSYDLQDKKDSFYYIETNKLSEGEIYFSDMDLNQENGKIEVPHKPIVRISTPLYSNDNTYQGILIINYLAQDFLNVFNEQFQDTEYSFIRPSLINSNGYYLHNKDIDKSFGFMFDEKKNISLLIEDPTFWDIIKSNNSGIYQKNNEVNFFMKVDPLSRISKKSNSDYYWVILSKFNLRDLPILENTNIFGMKDRETLMLIGISMLIFIIVTVNYYNKKDKEELNITKIIPENINDAVIITDYKTNIIYANNAFEKATGYSKDEVLGLKPNYFKSNKQSPEFYRGMWKSIHEKGYWKGELWDRKKDGMLYPKKINIFEINNNSNRNALKYIGIFTDLTKLKKEQEYIAKLKNYNFETNLPNENLLLRLINSSINGKVNNFFVIYFSIENYNSIMLDLEQDDQVFLNVLIERIKSMINEEDFIAQISKNNFVIGVSSLNNIEELEHFLEGFFEGNKKSVYLKEKELFFNIKAGISIYPKDASTANELIINAYIALEKVLDEKEKNYLYYEETFKNNIRKEVEMDLFLRKAILNNELNVYYQPQIQIDKEKIVGAEALIRWNNNQLGSISPDVFIPLAEKTGQIIEIGYWLIERIFKDYSSIKEKLSSDFRFSINVSPIQFKDKNLLPNFKKLIKQYKVNPENFEIEITESVLMFDVNIINEKLHEFKELGITVAIDDFGTGFSSLSYLKNLNIDKLKIDRSFIKDYPEKDNGEIAQVITNMANKLGLKVIGEGAETIEQVNYLQSVGCQLIQGYYYCRPLSKNDFYEYIHK